MRVITGTARGRRLKTPENYDIRPTTDNVKESVFNIIQFDIEGRRVLDLFAGTGQLGIECLSRGAAEAVFALIGNIQEETHRFAIEYQRSLRNESYASKLDAIPGVGEKRRGDLLKYFKSVKAIKAASVEQLRLVVPKNTAQAVYDFYHNEKSDDTCE